MLGIGIDTGGTYTDAVIFDTETHSVLSAGKSLTTHRELKQGILAALGTLDQQMVQQADYLALSTTLATNACVENKGGRAKLIFLGVDPKAVELAKGTYGLPPIAEICFVDCDPAKEENLQREPDWEQFRETVREEMQGFDSFAIVQIYPHYNGGIFEKKAEEIVKEETGAICVRGYDLYQELNVQKRGTTALLNARLLPVMQEFFDSIDRSLAELGLDLEIYVMKSDGSIMSKEFAMSRPVETLLCGPAASINGAIELTGVTEGMIIDMGGTTSDIGFIRDGQAVSSSAGVQVGGWRTMVKGVDIDTFALGGDSGVLMKYEKLSLGERRSIPLCIAVDTWPVLREKLKRLMVTHVRYSYIGELFLALMRMPEDLGRYTKLERSILEALQEEPMSFQELADRIGVAASMVHRHKQRLEDEDLIMRIGITPTDVMHIYGDYCGFDADAARMGIQWLARQCGRSKEAICREIYDLVEYKLYNNLVRILVKHQTGQDLPLEENATVKEMMERRFRSCQEDTGAEFVSMRFVLPMPLISTGAPTRIFLPAMERLFETEGIMPEYAHVANAVGAAAGSIVAEYTVRISRYGISRFLVGGADHQAIFSSYKEALAFGKQIASEKALEKAIKQGAEGDPHVDVEVDENFYRQRSDDTGVLIETRITGSVRIRI